MFLFAIAAGAALQKAALLLLLAALTAGMIAGRRGWKLPGRELPALAAIVEAIGRCAETGRPVLFTTGGASEIRRVELYASMPALRLVAGLAARYDVRLIVPVCYAQTLPVHMLAVQDARLEAADADATEEADVRFLPGGQFLFAVAAMGWMSRERPAACIYFGYWEADSLMFATQGRVGEALQIAATPNLPQTPFFLACCDHVLIGEEFWLAAAQLGGDPVLAGGLSAQDLIKLSVALLIVVGAAAATLPMGVVSDVFVAVRAAVGI